MSTVKNKQVISNAVCDLLEKFPDDHQTIMDMVVVFTGLDVSRPIRDVRPDKPGKKLPSKTAKDSSVKKTLSHEKKKAPTTATKAVAKEKSSVSTSSEDEKEHSGLIDLSDGKNLEEVPLLRLLTKSLVLLARRQKGASRPQMDHKSIKARITRNRKALRRALKFYAASHAGGNEDEMLLASFGLVNSLKSMKLTLSDAHKGGLTVVNLGVDLLTATAIPTVDGIARLARTLVERGLVRNESTGFYEDQDNVLITSVSNGQKAEVTNPFAVGDKWGDES